MIRLSRLADYAVVTMSHIALHPERLHNAPNVAAEVQLPAATVSKIMKALARASLLTSYRGVKGGYELARRPEEITVGQIISAVDGPIALTECIEDAPGDCDFETFCPTRRNWQMINNAVRRALDEVSLADLIAPVPAFLGAVRERTPEKVQKTQRNV